MRKLRVFRRLLGLGAAKIEDVFFEGELLVVRVVQIRRGGPAAGSSGGFVRAMTDRGVGGAGERLIWARCGPLWKLRSRVRAARRTAW